MSKDFTPKDFLPEEIARLANLKSANPLRQIDDPIAIKRLEFLKWRVKQSEDGLEELVPGITLAPDEDWKIPTPENKVYDFNPSQENLADLRDVVTYHVDKAFFDVAENPQVIHEQMSVSDRIKHRHQFPSPLGDTTMIYFEEDDRRRERVEITVYENMLREKNKLTKIRRLSAILFLDGWFDIALSDIDGGKLSTRSSYYKLDSKGRVIQKVDKYTQADLDEALNILTLGIDSLRNT